MSTGWIFSHLYPRVSRIARSLEREEGEHETYMMRGVSSEATCLRTLSSHPFLGGLRTVTSIPVPPVMICFISSTTSPASKSQLKTRFVLALSLASSTASSTDSIPKTLLAEEARNKDMEPTPQYRSRTFSLPVSEEKSRTRL